MYLYCVIDLMFTNTYIIYTLIQNTLQYDSTAYVTCFITEQGGNSCHQPDGARECHQASRAVTNRQCQYEVCTDTGRVHSSCNTASTPWIAPWDHCSTFCT